MKIVYKVELKMFVLFYFFGKFNKMLFELFIFIKFFVYVDFL